MELTEDRNIKC